MKDQINLLGVSDKESGSTAFFHSCHHDHHLYPPQHLIKKCFTNPIAWIDIEGEYIKLEAWDGVGQHQFNRLVLIPHLQFDICLIFFSVVHVPSFKNAINKWYQKVRSHYEHIDILFVGTHSQMRDKHPDKAVPKNIAKTIIEKYMKSKYLECSATTGEGVRAVYLEAVRMVMGKTKLVRHQIEEHTSCECPLI